MLSVLTIDSTSLHGIWVLLTLQSHGPNLKDTVPRLAQS